MWCLWIKVRSVYIQDKNPAHCTITLALSWTFKTRKNNLKLKNIFIFKLKYAVFHWVVAKQMISIFYLWILTVPSYFIVIFCFIWCSLFMYKLFLVSSFSSCCYFPFFPNNLFKQLMLTKKVYSWVLVIECLLGIIINLSWFSAL